MTMRFETRVLSVGQSMMMQHLEPLKELRIADTLTIPTVLS
jgi:hypothetical protein